jgi:hypothetical protein
MSGVDIKVFDNENMTYSSLVMDKDDPNYPAWRVTSKLIVNSVSMGGPSYSSAFQGGMAPAGGGRPMGGAMVGNQAALYDWGGSVKDDVQYIEVELEKIREDRRKAEEKLQKIKRKINTN